MQHDSKPTAMTERFYGTIEAAASRDEAVAEARRRAVRWFGTERVEIALTGATDDDAIADRHEGAIVGYDSVAADRFRVDFSARVKRTSRVGR